MRYGLRVPPDTSKHSPVSRCGVYLGVQYRGRVFTGLQCRSTTSPLTIPTPPPPFHPPRSPFIPPLVHLLRPPARSCRGGGGGFACLSCAVRTATRIPKALLTGDSSDLFKFSSAPRNSCVLCPHASFEMRFHFCRRRRRRSCGTKEKEGHSQEGAHS